MPLILNIDTSISTAYISLAKNGEVIGEAIYTEQKSHAANVHVAINEILKKSGLKISQIEAIAIAIGPGSYTGLRVGLSAAKGLCYALKIPLIKVGTLELMAIHAISKVVDAEDFLFCPMIDARRVEVFTAIYDANMSEILKPFASVLQLQSFAEIFIGHNIYFFGNGMLKWKNINKNKNSLYLDTDGYYSSLNTISLNKFLKSEFSDIAYLEPFYVKEFYSF